MLEAKSSTTFRDIQEVVQSAAETIAGGMELGLRLTGDIPTGKLGSTYTLPPGELLIAMFGCSYNFNSARSPLMQGRGPAGCYISLPGFARLPFRIKSYAPTDESTLYLKFTVFGTTPMGGEHAVGPDWQAQSEDILMRINTCIMPVLEQTDFDTLEDLVQNILTLVLSSRHAFRHVINISEVRVRAKMLEGKIPMQLIDRSVWAAHDEQSVVESLDQSSNLSHSPRTHGETDISVRTGESSLRESLSTGLGRATGEDVRPVESVLAEQGNHETQYADQTMQIAASADSPAGHDRAEDTTQDTKVGGVFIALGSNVGDRLVNIEKACREMDAEPGIRIVRTSALYETAPMYVTDQDTFLNGVCEASDPDDRVAIAC